MYFSQFYANRNYTNPTYATLDKGGRITANIREQWSYIPGTFRNISLSINDQFLPFDKARIGWGGSFSQSIEGESKLKYTEGGLLWGVAVPLGDFSIGNIKEHHITVGIGGRYNWINLNYIDNFVFSNQIDPITGPNLNINVNVPLSSELPKTYHSLDLGAIIQLKSKKMEVEFGAAAKNSNREQASLLGNGGNYNPPTRKTFHANILVPIGGFDKKSVLFSIKHDRQQQLRMYNFGAAGFLGPIIVGLYYQNADFRFWDIKNTQTLSFSVGGQWESYHRILQNQIVFSYDFNLTGLGGQTSGVLELSYILKFKNGFMGQYNINYDDFNILAEKRRRKRAGKCPKYERWKIDNAAAENNRKYEDRYR